jgi:alkaline phosphatase D
MLAPPDVIAGILSFMSVLLSRRAILQAAALLPGLALLPWSAIAGVPLQGFTHSVASGDPQQDSVVLWTRFVPAQGGEATLRVEIAEDEKFARIVSRGIRRGQPADRLFAPMPGRPD